ncbi:MAG: DedA family protein [Verrucomicrobiaceae bacterium]|nr:DedA family protein [Verrucomicrobiaceae bacterium]
MLHQFILTWFQWVQDWGYLGVIILMAMESSIFPVPSEVVMPPAAFLAAQGKLSLWGVILAGTFGSWLGSAITYAISRWLGRPFVLKFGKYFFISPEKLERAEVFMQRYEAGGIFFARLLPVVRHLISIPAGIVRMPFGKFSAMTIIGSFIWCAILSWYGKGIAERNPDLMKDPEAMIHAIKHESLGIIAGIAVIGVLYFLMLKMTGKKNA